MTGRNRNLAEGPQNHQTRHVRANTILRRTSTRQYSWGGKRSLEVDHARNEAMPRAETRKKVMFDSRSRR